MATERSVIPKYARVRRALIKFLDNLEDYGGMDEAIHYMKGVITEASVCEKPIPKPRRPAAQTREYILNLLKERGPLVRSEVLYLCGMQEFFTAHYGDWKQAVDNQLRYLEERGVLSRLKKKRVANPDIVGHSYTGHRESAPYGITIDLPEEKEVKKNGVEHLIFTVSKMEYAVYVDVPESATTVWCHPKNEFAVWIARQYGLRVRHFLSMPKQKEAIPAKSLIISESYIKKKKTEYEQAS